MDRLDQGNQHFLRCMNVLEAPTNGHIWIGTEEVTNPKTNIMHVRENVGMVFQHFHLFPHMTVLENITYAPINVKGVTKQEAEKKAEKLLEKVGLLDKKRYVSESSFWRTKATCSNCKSVSNGTRSNVI